MPDFARRAQQPELMDDPALDAGIYAAVIADLARVNTLTLARPPTLRWLARASVLVDFSSGSVILQDQLAIPEAKLETCKWAAANAERAAAN